MSDLAPRKKSASSARPRTAGRPNLILQRQLGRVRWPAENGPLLRLEHRLAEEEAARLYCAHSLKSNCLHFGSHFAPWGLVS